MSCNLPAACCRQSSSLKEANEELARKAESLLERQQQLEQSADTLQQENAKLLLQVGGCQGSFPA